MCVCLLVTFVSPAKTAELIKLSFRIRTWVGPRKLVLDGGADPSRRKGNFGDSWRSIIKYWDTTERCRNG